MVSGCIQALFLLPYVVLKDLRTGFPLPHLYSNLASTSHAYSEIQNNSSADYLTAKPTVTAQGACGVISPLGALWYGMFGLRSQIRSKYQNTGV